MLTALLNSNGSPLACRHPATEPWLREAHAAGLPGASEKASGPPMP